MKCVLMEIDNAIDILSSESIQFSFSSIYILHKKVLLFHKDTWSQVEKQVVQI